jgi:hypothetical protein
MISCEQFRVFIGTPFGYENLGVKQVDEGVWQVQFMDHVLGFFDEEHQKIQIVENPFLPNRSE